MWRLLLVLAMATALARPVAAESLPRSVLVFDQSDTNSPWGLAFRSTVRSEIANRSKTSVAMYSEILELGRFNGPQYEKLLRAFLQDKYRDRPIGVIVVHGSAALEMFMRLRADLWPSVPVVFAFVDPKTLEQLNLPPDFTGATNRLSLRNVVVSARVAVPNLKRIALVGTRYENDPFRPHFVQERAQLASEVEFVDLLDLPLTEVTDRASALPDDAAIYYSTLYATGANTSLILVDVVPVLARAANRPIVTDNPGHIGLGSTGGLVMRPEPMARDAADRAIRILDGESPSRMPIVAGDFAAPVFDWRQLQRWNISEARLPPGTEVRFRSPSAWEQYRWQIISMAAVLVVQTLLIAGLLYQRYWRYYAEMESRSHLLQAMHLNRAGAAGALSAAIAHELNQPLGAILSNAEAAEILLEANPPDVVQLKEIVADILQADRRAADVIQHMRTLLKRKSEIELHVFDLNEAVKRTIQILSPEAGRRGIELIIKSATEPLQVRADRVHLEQVILNLAMNGMDAMAGFAAGERKMKIETVLTGMSEVEVSVGDTGTGIPKEKLKNVFDTFYTTKQHGTGLGLSIARTIVETYGGRIWAENQPRSGAVLRFTLPLVQEQVS